MSINVANTVPGTFGTSGPISGGGAGRSPREDPGAIGAINDILVVFDPAARGTSPVNIDVAFSVPAYDISFIISDVDGSTQNGRFGTRWDQVEVTYTDRFGNAGLPATIEPNTHAQPVIVGNVAYSRSPTFLADFDNTGNLLVRVPDGATAFRIVYKERGNTVPGFTFSNPSARGIGILGGLAFSPDVDRDGVPDALDTDSDNDGCFDAVEAGIPGIFNNVGVVSDGRLLGAILDNGQPAVSVGVTPSPNVYNAAVQGPQCITIPDTDGDGVLDISDLDNDNDGIPNIVECPRPVPYDVYSYSRTNSAFATNLQATVIGATTTTTSINQTQVPNDFTFVNTPYRLLARGVTAAANGTITTQFSVNPNAGGQFALVDAIILVDPAGRVTQIDNLSPGYSDVGNWETSTNQSDGGTIGPNSRFVRAANYGGVDVATFQLAGLAVAVDCDPDRDGIANDFDLDSDGDGCFDALESGNPNVTFDSGTNANGSLVGASQPNGIPVAADANNDGVVDFTVFQDFLNPNIQSPACTPPADKDGDGVPDLTDLDDDNDGIPDADEMVQQDEIGVDFGFGATNYPDGQRSAMLTGPNGITYDISFTGGTINSGFSPRNQRLRQQRRYL